VQESSDEDFLAVLDSLSWVLPRHLDLNNVPAEVR
jgi:hypothetical protein